MKKVTVLMKEYPESWIARSPDIGYYAGADTFDELRRMVSDGVPFYLGEPVEIIEVLEEQNQVKTA